MFKRGERTVLFPEYVHFTGAEAGFFPAGSRTSGVEEGFGGVACSRHAILVEGTRGAGHGGVTLG